MSSAAHAAVPVFAISTAYTVGQFVRRITSTPRAQWVMRVTVAGTSAASEPTWPTTNNGTVVSGGATFQNVTGQSAYGWSAAAGDLATLLGAVGTTRIAGGDRVFISSDHSETQTAAVTYGAGNGVTASYSVIQYICVNRAGSVPPVAADVTSGATITNSVQININADCPCYHTGINWVYTGTSLSAIVLTASSRAYTLYFNNCQFYLNSATANLRFTAGSTVQAILDNTTFRFGATSHSIGNVANQVAWDFIWQNTPSAISALGSTPAVLFTPGVNLGAITCRGVDLSAVTGTLSANSSGNATRCLFDSCRIASGVTRYVPTGTNNTQDAVELVNCYDGTNIISERYQPAGAVTTERTITLLGGATDDVGVFSHKMVSNANVDKYANTLNSFWLDCEYQVTGASKTATVEIISVALLNNDEISLLLEYQGTAGSSVATFATSLPATVLTTAAAVTTSTVPWNASPTATWNPADLTSVNLSNGNLTASATFINSGIRANGSFTSGKLFFEYTWTALGNFNAALGLALSSAPFTTAYTDAVVIQGGTGNIIINGVNSGTSLGARATGNVISIAVDLTAKLIWFRVAPAGNWNNSGTANPATGVGGINISGLTGALYPIFLSAANLEVATANFGSSAFISAVPSGFTAGLFPTSGKQKLQVTFTPQLAGRVRGQVRLGKASTTVYIDPVLRIT